MAVAIRGTNPVTGGVDASATVSVTLTGSSQPQAGDLLVIFHCNDFYTLANMPTPTVGGSTSGVTNILDADSGTNGAHARLWWFAVPSTGDLTVSVTETGSADEDKALVVYVLSGADTASPVDASGSAIDTGGSTHNCPDISPATSDAFLICHTNTGGGASGGGNGSYTHPSGMTETVDNAFTAGMHVGGAVLQLVASGATGTKTFTPGSAVTDQANVSVAIKTASAAAADTTGWPPARPLPGRIGPDRKVYLPRRFDESSAAAPIDVAADTAVLTLTGVDVTLAGSGAASVIADTATLTFAGVDSTLAGTAAASVAADPATLTFVGVDVTASTGGSPINVTADIAVLTFVGVTPTIAGTGAASIAADTATLVLQGVTPTLVGSGASSVAADTAVLTFVGVDVSAFSGQLVTPESRIYRIPTERRTATIPAEVRTLPVPADPRTFTVPAP